MLENSTGHLGGWRIKSLFFSWRRRTYLYHISPNPASECTEQKRNTSTTTIKTQENKTFDLKKFTTTEYIYISHDY